MRIAIVSDVHGNRRAFEAVLADLREVAPDRVMHGGDLAAGGSHPAEIVDHIRSLGWAGVCGNTDEMLRDPEQLTEFAATLPPLARVFGMVGDAIPWTVAQLGEERLRWLAALPKEFVQEGFRLVHASPGDLWRCPGPRASEEELRRVYGGLGAGIVVHAHVHVPYVRKLEGLIVANTGSVSQSYDGDTRASYLVMDGDELAIRRVEYDVGAAAEDVAHCGVPHGDWMAKILLAGRYVAPE